MTLPSKKSIIILTIFLAVWLGITGLFVGFRVDHLLLTLIVVALFMINRHTRCLLAALLPFLFFAISYDFMNIVHNYEVNSVDIQGIYETEKSLFGIATAQGTLTPNEFLAIHRSPIFDFLGGVFYLCWVPVPIAYGIWLYLNGQEKAYLHFALVFLFANFIGFAGYYIHPAAPPWYVAKYGFDFLLGTPGDVAGLGAFDDMTRLGVFDMLYGRNSNVFAAVPSLHSAYTFIAFIYSLRSRTPNWMRILLGVVTIGIWATAVYTSHHYLIDVLLGISCALLAFVLFEYVLMRIPLFKRFMSRYVAYIEPLRH